MNEPAASAFSRVILVARFCGFAHHHSQAAPAKGH
jgi:hypothetical protein